MTRPLRLVVRFLRHTRIVPAGSPPLYRLMLLGSFISGILQSFDRQAPVSVTSITPDWGDWLFIGTQGVFSIMALAGLYLTEENKAHASKLNDSLWLEFFGLIGIQTVITVNVVAVMFYYDRPPTGQGTWFQIVFWGWCWFRLRDIRRVTKELARDDS